ncbi:N-acylneuraminate cytidylyltransferase [Candidatus Planktophila dulcis]|uniref:acylneuraminate cytidylyltransferase family protein n=1 Tax=Candidatus Planktophila dulcis TaxID=1884914 RepID=UPI000BC0E264|nr:hypothetical protein [Candidatus Planktophila dulcis]ASY14018.1 N-acylneuraminate cytidylyltransferase [Candidatus Planktophila dulcis]
MIAIIPARGGSQGIPRKNISELFGTPLIMWTINFALTQNKFDAIVISTDCPEIAGVVAASFQLKSEFSQLTPGEFWRLHENLFIHKRLDELSSSTSKTSDLVTSLVRDFELKDQDLIFLLQPTSPFRVNDEVEQILDLVAEGFSRIVSVKKAESPHPKKVFQMDQSKRPLNLRELSNLESPRQSLGEYFAPDGAYYVLLVSEFLETKSFISQDLFALERVGLKTLNIDSIEDLEIANLYAPIFINYEESK